MEQTSKSGGTGILALLPLYIGGFMGPFGTLVILPMFPELRDSFDSSLKAVGWGFTIYLFPFALLLLVSGTLGERWGRRRTVRITYLTYTVASVLCALAPNLGFFLAGRALQGVANAFITPLLVAGLAEVVHPDRFGRSLGIYSSFQAIGGGLAPLAGGLAADQNWRIAFWVTAAISLVLATRPPVGEPRPTDWPPIKPLLTRPMISLGIGSLAGAMGPMGIAILVGVAAREEMNLSGGAAGAILFVSAFVAMLLGPLWGRLTDRVGMWRVAVPAAVCLTAASLTLGFALAPIPLTLLWAITGGLAALVVIVLQGLGATLVPDNRGGALSFLLSFRFLGTGLGPLVWLPVFERSVTTAFVGASLLGIITIAAFVFAAPGPARLSAEAFEDDISPTSPAVR